MNGSDHFDEMNAQNTPVPARGERSMARDAMGRPRVVTNQDEERIRLIFAYRGQVPLPDPREPSNPTFTEMVRLSSMHARDRDRLIEPYFRGWIEKRANKFQVARYLAATGMSFDEARTMEKILREEISEPIRRFGMKILLSGVLFGLIGTGILVGQWLSFLSKHPLWGVLAVLFFLGSLGSIWKSTAILNRITAPDDGLL